VFVFTGTIQIGQFGRVYVEARDQHDNLATSEERDVQASATGDAIGASTVSIVHGRGSFYLTDPTAETVTLTLVDSSNTNLDVTHSIAITFTTGKHVS
jgi:hypothetical protein